MAFLSSCLCCSLLTGSIIIGIMATLLYAVAFGVELYMIIETDVSLSVPAYILTIGYLLMSLLSLCMIVSLRYQEMLKYSDNIRLLTLKYSNHCIIKYLHHINLIIGDFFPPQK